MKVFFLSLLSFIINDIHAQSPCDDVKLYDEVTILGERPILQKLKQIDLKSVPDSTMRNMKKEFSRLTSKKIFEGLTIKSVKLFDSARAKAWAQRNDPIVDMTNNPVHFFYAFLFETKTKGTTLVFRVDILRNGKLVNEKQISFIKGGLDIIGCNEVVKIVLADSIQPVKSVEFMTLAYSNEEQKVVWSILSAKDASTGNQHLKDVNAVTGEIFRRVLIEPIIMEETKIQTGN